MPDITTAELDKWEKWFCDIVLETAHAAAGDELQVREEAEVTLCLIAAVRHLRGEVAHLEAVCRHPAGQNMEDTHA